MTSLNAQDRADAELRALLAQIDPASAGQGPSDGLLERVLEGIATSPRPVDRADPHVLDEGMGGGRSRWMRRHWQAVLLGAATVAGLALAVGTALPGLTGDEATTAQSPGMSRAVPGVSGGAAGTEAGEGAVAGSADLMEPGVAVEDGAPAGASERAGSADSSAPESTTGSDAAGKTAGSAQGTAREPSQGGDGLVRSASLLVGTADTGAARDAFVERVLTLGGRVTSETVVTDGEPVTPLREDQRSAPVPGDMYLPLGRPGIYLSVQVPAADHDKAVAAARSTGDVVTMQQSSYDVGDQITDVEARIAALRASVARLAALMDEAEGISDVIALEQATAQRQSELDSLVAVQRDLANRTQMSQVSLALMHPDDARAATASQGEPWWSRAAAWLSAAWAWLGRALLIVSPLLVAGVVVWRARRRGGSAQRPRGAT